MRLLFKLYLLSQIIKMIQFHSNDVHNEFLTVIYATCLIAELIRLERESWSAHRVANLFIY